MAAPVGAAAAAAGDALTEWLSELGKEDAHAKLQACVITASRVLSSAAEMHNLRDVSPVSAPDNHRAPAQ